MSNKIALVTGANKGIGYEIVRQLAALEFTVFLGARDKSRGEAAVAKLRETAADVHYLPLDVTDDKSVKAAVEHIQTQSGNLDVLVNNAGVNFESRPPSVANLDLIKKTFETNYFGVIRVTQAMLPLLRASQTRVIVNVSSELGSTTLHGVPEWPYHAVNLLGYNSSKTALNAFTVLLAKELRSEGFKINSVNPGYVATDLNQFSGKGTPQDGATVAVKCARLGDDGPTGNFFTEGGILPW